MKKAVAINWDAFHAPLAAQAFLLTFQRALPGCTGTSALSGIDEYDLAILVDHEHAVGSCINYLTQTLFA